ncbi:MAG: pyruvate formate-lyase [Ruminococcaceae bacterium]|nr:pyruvate formate-lyase [Oscillospiraceae bacterium]
MTRKVERMLSLLRSGEYKRSRYDNTPTDVSELIVKEPEELAETVVLETMLSEERPFFVDGDIFGFNRYNKKLPTGSGLDVAYGNITPNYARIIETGFDSVLEEIERNARENSNKTLFYEAIRRDVVAVIDICDRYREAAEREGKERIAEALGHIPKKGARSFYEACLFMKLLIYSQRCVNTSHITLGRFDKYMFQWYELDKNRGVSEEELFETLEMFFIGLNTDTDLYFGMQQGDNGQSMVLGGIDKDGNDSYNELSELCMRASLELSLIDPKINLRVNKKTPAERYELGTRLTKQGLGFPQYCNDDVIIPYMINMGYSENDAYDYTVAACWECISPYNGIDVPNIDLLIFPTVVNDAVRKHLMCCESFDALLVKVREAISEECAAIRERSCEKYMRNYGRHRAVRYLSLFTDGCIESGLDIFGGGAKYKNFGCHGTGIANAADALAAIKRCVFDVESVTKAQLLAALESNYEGAEELRQLLCDCPKMGNNDDYVDSIAASLMDMFSECMSGAPNGIGGVWRAGTGSAFGYAKGLKCPATADGRHAGEYFSCSFSPSINTRLAGPLSVVKSFTKYDLGRICNGGPLTMELHNTVFRNEDGEKKVAQLVRAFILLGGHQLQLNAINRETLLDAEAHPERYPNLIVRVWGWSGYFCELEKKYRDHIIKRTEFSV